MTSRRDPGAALVADVRRLAARISDRPVDSWTLEQCELLNQSADRLHRAAWAAACWLASTRSAPGEGEDTGEPGSGALRPSERLESDGAVDNSGTAGAKPPGASDLRQDAMGHPHVPNVIPVQPHRRADPEPEPTPPAPEPIVLTFQQLGGRRIYRDNAPAADQDGQVTLPFDGQQVQVPGILVDAFRHGPPLNNYVTDDQLRQVIATVTASEPEGATP